jgi:hypothetical protein
MLMGTASMVFGVRRVGLYTILLLIGAGALLFLALLLEWPPASWSRTAIGLQALALVLALLLAPRLPSMRLLLYPLALACGIYLWDTTLPPPTLPEGPLRAIIPGSLLLLLLVDSTLTLQRWRQTRWRTIQIRGRTLMLDDAAALLRTTPDDLRRQLARAGRPARSGEDGHERVTLDDLNALLE